MQKSGETEIHPLARLSVVIPARNEDGCVVSTVKHLYRELSRHQIPHEIIVVNDGSSDKTEKVLEENKDFVPTLRILRNPGPYGFARAVVYGMDRMEGNAFVLYMADESDEPRDVVRYWDELKKGFDSVFGSRFIKGGSTTDYPWPKWILNRLGNKFIQLLFGLRFNDVTNAFKAYRRETLASLRPFLSSHFELTVELPLKAILRGSRWTVIPVGWQNRKSGLAKFKIEEIGSRYLSIIWRLWLERFQWRNGCAQR